MIDFRVLGPLDLRGAEGQTILSILSGPKRVAFLAYLAIEGSDKFLRRDKLLALFWPESDTERARSSLRSALSTLRRSLGEQVIVTRGDEEIALQEREIRCDAVEFQHVFAAGRYEEAMNLYRGHLLEGFFISEASEFEHWLDRTRERLKLRAVEAAWLLADQYEAVGNAARASGWAARATELAADDEDALCRQIELLNRLGDPEGALKVYDEFARRLAPDDMGPSARTHALVQAVRAHAEQEELAAGLGAPSARTIAHPVQAAPGGVEPLREREDIGPPGEARQKDLGRFGPVVQPAARLISADIPAPAAPPPRPHNLPAQLTPLIGRTRERAAIRDKLLDNEVRLLTLTGAGGTGKTRLAVRVATEVLNEFEEGVWFVDFATISEPALVVPTIARALGLRDAGEPSASGQQLAEYLRHQRMLLVLDTFEQVADASPDIVELLGVAPRLKILATSQAALRLSMEHEYPVPPLSVPDPSPTPSVPALSRYDAVQLFVARAQAARPDFYLDEANAGAVGQICTQLEGLPLAIELAAARVKIFSPDAIRARLGSKLKLLTGGARDLPARQQTLRNTMDWSYGLLNAQEKKLFSRMSVFAGGCTLDAAESVCTAPGDLATDVLDGLTSLVNNSLIHHRQGTGGEPRWVMLATVCEYARERLEESREANAAQTEHARFFLNLATEAAPHLRGREQAIWLRGLEEEHNNLRAALRWALGTGPETKERPHRDREAALRVGAAVWRFWWTHGHLNEGRRWLKLALATHGQEGVQPATPAADAHIRAEALRGGGILAWDQGDYAEARVLLEESLALSRRVGDKQGIADSLNNLGLVVQDEGDPAAAESLFQESLAIRREIGDNRGISTSLNNLGKLARQQGDYVEARALLQESLALDRELGSQRGVATVLYNLGTVANAQEDYAGARGHFSESLQLYRDLGDKRGIVECLEGLAVTTAGLGQLKRSIRLLAAAETLRHAIGAPPSPSERYTRESVSAATREQLEPAAWQEAWENGRAMTLEEAVAEALEG